MIKVVKENGLNPSNSKKFKPDDVIKKYNGIEVRSKADLLRLIEVSKGTKGGGLDIVILRQNAEITINVKPGSLGLKLVSMQKEDELVERLLLDKANETIRRANIRIEELKVKLNQMETGKPSVNDLSPLEIMGLSSMNNEEELKRNYKKLSLIYHPDRCESQGMMKIINRAYEEISSQDKKANR